MWFIMPFFLSGKRRFILYFFIPSHLPAQLKILKENYKNMINKMQKFIPILIYK